MATVCLADRGLDLASDACHQALLSAWKDAHAWRVGAYVILPDHIHLFCVPGLLPPVGIKNWCKFWKGQFRRHMRLEQSVWQRDVWDTQMRDYAHYVEKREYVRRNPVRRGLVGRAEDWPYQGEIHVIRW